MQDRSWLLEAPGDPGTQQQLGATKSFLELSSISPAQHQARHPKNF